MQSFKFYEKSFISCLTSRLQASQTKIEINGVACTSRLGERRGGGGGVASREVKFTDEDIDIEKLRCHFT